MKFVWTIMGAFLTSTVSAGHFLGFSTETVTGNAGLLGMNNACIAEYGENAKFCSSKDIILSPSLTAQSGQSWVRPHIVASTTITSNVLVDYSGISGSVTDLSCRGWGIEAGVGLGINGANLAFMSLACGAEYHVACCKSSAAYRIAPN